MLRRFLVIFAAFVSLSAWAACTQYQVKWRAYSSPWSSTKEAACSAINGQSVTLGTGTTAVTRTVTGAAVDANGNCAYKETNTPANPGIPPSTFSTSAAIQERSVAQCDDQCAPNAGKTSMLNFTAGWARSATPNSGDYVGELSFPAPGATFCAEGCAVETGNVDNCYRSDVPAPTGLHRISCDYSMVGKGTQCTASAVDAAHDKTQPPLPCPGFVGEVNGQTKCVGTASKPIPPPSGPGVTQATGATEDKGNPTAGTKPSSGEGSGTGGAGRTPSTGSGTAAGGPAAAAGSNPDGTTPKPDEGKEQAACGAPGQPKCGIDESGTPGKFDGDKAALDGWKSSVEANRNTIKDTDGGFFNSFNLFFSAPPVVACEAIELPNEQVITRHCDVVDGTRSVMSYIWALAAIWLCLGWIREAI